MRPVASLFYNIGIDVVDVFKEGGRNNSLIRFYCISGLFQKENIVTSFIIFICFVLFNTNTIRGVGK